MGYEKDSGKSEATPADAESSDRRAHVQNNDNFNPVDEFVADLRRSGLESTKMIFGIDFTKSNETAGEHSFNGRSLHEIGSVQNPYEQTISIIGRTLSSFNEDNKIPCFGFGDANTKDQSVFGFFPNSRPCNGFEEAIIRYREIVPDLTLAEPKSFASIIEAATNVVDRSGGQYHVLAIVADGQVTRSSDTEFGCYSPQERKTVEALNIARKFPLSIVLIGVGDGPWDAMQQFDDNIYSVSPNFQFVNFTSIMSKNMTASEKEATFARAALSQIPSQYIRIQRDNLLGPAAMPIRSFQSEGQSAEYWQELVCHVCFTNPKGVAFGCGHMTCAGCSEWLNTCHMCRKPISGRLKLYFP